MTVRCWAFALPSFFDNERLRGGFLDEEPLSALGASPLAVIPSPNVISARPGVVVWYLYGILGIGGGGVCGREAPCEADKGSQGAGAEMGGKRGERGVVGPELPKGVVAFELGVDDDDIVPRNFINPLFFLASVRCWGLAGG